jgi:lipopolysaccharide biosynthesis protein
MLLIYRIGHIPNAKEAVRALRAALRERAAAEVHIAAAWAHFQDDVFLPANPEDLGLDAYFEFPPHRLRSCASAAAEVRTNFRGKMYDYNCTVAAALSEVEEPVLGRRHRAVMLGWDNTARMGLRSHIFHGATPANFRRWLRGTVAHEQRQKGDRVVFVNAWNEWAEGAYLEPDCDFGLGWLEAVASAVQTG